MGGGNQWQRRQAPAQGATKPAQGRQVGSGPGSGGSDSEESDEDMYEENPGDKLTEEQVELEEARKTWRQSKKLLRVITGIATPEVMHLIQAQHRAARERLDGLRPAQERMKALRDSEASRVKYLEKLGPQIAEAKLALAGLETRYQTAEAALRQTRQQIVWCQASMPDPAPPPLAEAGPRSDQGKALLAMAKDPASVAELQVEVAVLQAHLAKLAEASSAAGPLSSASAMEVERASGKRACPDGQGPGPVQLGGVDAARGASATVVGASATAPGSPPGEAGQDPATPPGETGTLR